MRRVFVDTNVFLRFFTHDDAGQHRRAGELFRAAAEGDLELVTGPPVLFELYWTLTSGYEKDVSEALDMLQSILSQEGIVMTDASVVEAAIERAREASQEFPDAYISALADSSHCEAVATFNDRDFVAVGARVYEM